MQSVFEPSEDTGSVRCDIDTYQSGPVNPSVPDVRGPSTRAFSTELAERKLRLACNWKDCKHKAEDEGKHM